MEYIRCTNCDYECYYSSGLYEYTTEYLSPEIEKGFCLDCNIFVDIQKGIDINIIAEKIKSYKSELKEWDGIWFKTSSQKERVIELKNKIESLLLLARMNNFKSSVPTCVNCEHSNIISKDVDKSVWICPKCSKGRLYKHTEESSIRFRIVPKTIYPVVNSRRFRTGVFVYRCAYDILLSDLYILKSNDINIVPAKDNFGILLEATSFIYSYLSVNMRSLVEYNEEQFIEDLWLLLGKMSGMKEAEFKSKLLHNIKYYKKCIESQKFHHFNTYHEMLHNILFPKSDKSLNALHMKEVKIIPDSVINLLFQNKESIIKQYFKYS